MPPVVWCLVYSSSIKLLNYSVEYKVSNTSTVAMAYCNHFIKMDHLQMQLLIQPDISLGASHLSRSLSDQHHQHPFSYLPIFTYSAIIRVYSILPSLL